MSKITKLYVLISVLAIWPISAFALVKSYDSTLSLQDSSGNPIKGAKIELLLVEDEDDNDKEFILLISDKFGEASLLPADESDETDSSKSAKEGKYEAEITYPKGSGLKKEKIILEFEGGKIINLISATGIGATSTAAVPNNTGSEWWGTTRLDAGIGFANTHSDVLTGSVNAAIDVLDQQGYTNLSKSVDDSDTNFYIGAGWELPMKNPGNDFVRIGIEYGQSHYRGRAVNNRTIAGEQEQLTGIDDLKVETIGFTATYNRPFTQQWTLGIGAGLYREKFKAKSTGIFESMGVTQVRVDNDRQTGTTLVGVFESTYMVDKDWSVVAGVRQALSDSGPRDANGNQNHRPTIFHIGVRRTFSSLTN